MAGKTIMRAAALGLAILASVMGCDRQAEAPDPAPTVDGQIAPVRVRTESATLAEVKRRGRLNCGVHEGLVGFAYTDNRGEWRGFDVDFCRGLAAAIFGAPDAVRFVPLTAENRFQALADGRIDVLWRNT
ncbi:transporter substrate-binding domain-containing protein, partial [Brevundimonas sp.]|uniref:transporter substrate-binding domain-containing protein n=1 Tax=Brevundimonas sp. TaxID=1871086 RepID=UPI002ABB9AD8